MTFTLLAVRSRNAARLWVLSIRCLTTGASAALPWGRGMVCGSMRLAGPLLSCTYSPPPSGVVMALPPGSMLSGPDPKDGGAPGTPEQAIPCRLRASLAVITLTL